MKVLSFGEILYDCIEGTNYLGGAPLNFAAHLAQCGAEAYIFSKVGADALGRQALREVEALGVNTSLIQVDREHPTGTVQVQLRQGQPDYTICENVAYDFISLPESVPTRDEGNFDVLYFGTLAQRNKQSREALRQLVAQNSFREVFYDVNLRKGFYSAEILRESLQRCTILKLNDEEVSVLSHLLFGEELEIEAFARKVVENFTPKVVIITTGAKGCQIFENDRLNFVPGFSVPVVDTVGAGDAFSAAFVYKYGGGNSATQAAEAANRLGAFVASSRGPIPVYSPELRIALGVGESHLERRSSLGEKAVGGEK